MSAKYKKSALFKVTVKDKASGKRLKGIKVIMKVYTGKKYKKIVHKTNKKGKTGFNIKSLSKGKHKVVVIVKATSKFKKASKRTSIKITKPTKKAVSIKAKKLSAKYKSGKKFKAKVIESKSKKPVKGIKVTLKVGNKKAVTLKTNKNGIVKYSTKKLKVGNYKVVLKVKATSKFKQASKKTSIKIVKKSSSKKISTKLGLGGPRGLIYEWHYADTGLNDGVVIYPKLIDSNGRTLTKKVTVITSSGKKTGYTGRGIFLGNDFDADFVPMTRGGTARIIFHGDSKYAGSEYTVYF